MIITQETRREAFLAGMRSAIPIGLAYFAVSFAFGLSASEGGMSAAHAALISLLCLTSAGQFAGLTVILFSGALTEIFLTQVVINLRYLLMSFSLSQKLEKKASLLQRLIVAFGVTDEIFAVSAAREGALSPFFSFGAMSVAIPGWVLGTLSGGLLGNVLPDALLRALSVALYGMFLAIIIPPAKKDRKVLCAIVIAMGLSAVCTYAPLLRQISAGFRIILVTVIVAAGMAAVTKEVPRDGKER